MNEAGDEWRLDSAASLEPVKAALQSLEGVFLVVVFVVVVVVMVVTSGEAHACKWPGRSQVEK